MAHAEMPTGDRRPRVAILVNSPMFNGAERRAVKLYQGLRGRGAPVELWVTRRFRAVLEANAHPSCDDAVVYDDDPLWLNAFDKGRRFRRLRRTLMIDRIEQAVKTRRLNRLIRERRIDVLHVFLDLGLSGDGLDAKIIFEITSPDFLGHVKTWSARRRRSFTLFNAVSDGVYEKARGVIAADRLTAPPAALFDPAGMGAPHDSWADKKNLIVFAHRLKPRKNGVLFARAAAAFLDSHPDWNVRVLGDGPDAGEIASILKRYVDAGRAWVGRKSNIASDLFDAKIFVSLIEPDNYPSQSVFEAMHAEAALLISNTGYSVEKFIDNNGLVCDLDHEDIESKLSSLASDELKMAQCGKKSKSILLERYNIDAYMCYIESIYKY